MKNHLLASYFHAVLSVALAQFSTRGFADGMPGIIRLAETSSYVQVLASRHLSSQHATLTWLVTGPST